MMTVAVFGLLAVFPQTLRSTRKSGEISVLNHMAAQHLEYVKSVDYISADLATGTHPSQSSDSTGDKYYPVAGFAEEYSARWIVTSGPTDAGGTAESQMKTVTIEVSHRLRYKLDGTVIDDPDGIEVTLQTYVTE